LAAPFIYGLIAANSLRTQCQCYALALLFLLECHAVSIRLHRKFTPHSGANLLRTQCQCYALALLFLLECHAVSHAAGQLAGRTRRPTVPPRFRPGPRCRGDAPAHGAGFIPSPLRSARKCTASQPHPKFIQPLKFGRVVVLPCLRCSLRSAWPFASLTIRRTCSRCNAPPSLGLHASTSSGCACSLPAALIRAALLGFVAGSLWVAPPCPTGSLGVLAPPLFGRSLCSLFFFLNKLRFVGFTCDRRRLFQYSNPLSNKPCKIRPADFSKVT